MFQYDTDEDDEDDENDADEDGGHEPLAPHRDDILIPPALPDIAAVDPDGKLRAKLLKKGNTSWGGRSYAWQSRFQYVSFCQVYNC